VTSLLLVVERDLGLFINTKLRTKRGAYQGVREPMCSPEGGADGGEDLWYEYMGM
jgi:hypothetical protein